ncbi:hypothetical protein QE152_g25862 [Popillia japonica]|uniref:Uncharacterized protein n=1 Tax=Popillia japonica TaxID=7064 RepID=A0AAW1K0K9_POPJA
MAANQRHESSLETRGKIIALWDVGYTTHEIADEIDLSQGGRESFAPPPGRNKALEPDLAYIQVTSNLADVNINSTASAVDNRISNANTNNNRSDNTNRTRYDLRHRPVSFYPNQVVWRKNFVLSDASKFYAAKLADKFIGPFLIHRKVSPTTYELKDQNGKVQPGTWNVEHLKPHPHDD